ncbi:hypothetical protein GLA29479_5038 [Lysobacter antibioticus]|nr:hypothetical protein GLA29479_5038 [Lysobacter antibioticus]
MVAALRVGATQVATALDRYRGVSYKQVQSFRPLTRPGYFLLLSPKES